MNKTNKVCSPWSWIPTLYIAEGLPYFAVNTLTVLMYTNLGISKGEMAFLTGWLYLPWVIKPFWSPFVDMFSTKRRWILAMQALICLSMGCVALALPFSGFLLTTLIAFWIMAFASATHDIAADGLYILALDPERQAAFVGVRSTFYRIASVLGQGGIVIFAGWLEVSLGDIPKAWGLTFGSLSLLFLLFYLYHIFFLPKVAADKSMPGRSGSGVAREFLDTFITFFRKGHIIVALSFMLLYRLPEALCLKLVQPFLHDPIEAGGLGMSTASIGFANGTVGVVCLLAGGILGGILISRIGLRKSLLPMAASLTLPCLAYCYLSAVQPASLTLISILIGFEQLGYGFGFTSFMMYLMYFCRGENTTSHYAFCTAFMALGMMMPGMFAGWIFESLDSAGPLLGGLSAYEAFFWLIMLLASVTFAVTFLVRKTLPENL
ncbi:MAG: AmpG family muropeptide MFS transporter [Bacteroides sp.]|nr:AmpG family muropeptide MFS transporter [Bacteroides sp.]